jgi:Pex19 protein family
MMQEMLKGMGAGGIGAGFPEMGSSVPGMQDNPMLGAFNQMFKDFEQVSKDSSSNGGPSAGAGAPGMPPGMDELLKNLMGGLGGAAEGGSDEGGMPDAAGMEKLMAEFSNFLKDSEGNEDMKSALDSVVNELLTKDTLYEPMKTLRDEYPNWLEANWDKVSQKDLENYNNQLDKITEICNYYEAHPGQDEGEQAKVFEMLA